MKKLLACFAIALASLNAPAQARTFNQPELDALLAPVALYPDSLLDQILVAATYPHQVAEAAQWSRSNPRLSGDEAVRAAEPYGWHPSVAALAAFPDVLGRLGESPQWVRELGEAWLNQEPHVLDTVQQLRRRAEASGNLRSDEHQQVYRRGETIVVQPVYAEVVFVHYYNPLIVFGPWWWHSHRPVYWRPWHPHPVRWHWAQHQQHRPVHRAAPVQRAHAPVRAASRLTSTPYVRVPESQRRPIVNSAPLARPMPAPSAFSRQKPQPRAQPQHPPRQAQQQRRDRRG